MGAVERAEGQFQRLHEHEFNTALVTNQRFAIRTAEWETWADIAETYQIDLFPILNFAGKDEVKVLSGTFSPYINRFGEALPATPCPADEAYWAQSFGKRFEELARLTLRIPLSGGILDTEMYGGKISVYRDPCLCDICWQHFVEASSQGDVRLSKEQRWQYLTEHQLLEHYAEVQREQVQQILAPLARRVYAINPGMRMGLLAYLPNWYYKGLILGLGSVEHPVLVCTESTYIQGYTAYVHHEMATVKEETREAHREPIARYLPGVWLGRFFPFNLPMHLHALATHTDGYWIFTADSLWKPVPMPEPYSLNGSTAQYWSALKQANERIQRKPEPVNSSQELARPPYLPSFYDNVLNRLFTQSSLPTMLHAAHEEAAFRPAEPPTRLIAHGKTLFHAFHDPNKGNASIHIRHVPVGAYHHSLAYRLFEADEMVFREGRITKAGGSVTVPLPPHVSGVISLLIEAAGNAAEVSFSGMPHLVEASTTFPVRVGIEPQRYSMYVKAEQTSIQLRAYCPDHETALITLESPDEEESVRIEVNGFTEMNIPLTESAGITPMPSSRLSLLLTSGKAVPLNPRQSSRSSLERGRMWTITIHPVESGSGERVEFSLLDAEFPYLFREE